MNPADLARQNAIPLEVKKDGLQQRQNGDWVLRFVVQAADMDERITKAAMGTRFQIALVIIGDDELPITLKAKESSSATPATPEVAHKPPPPAKRDHMNWRELHPAAQAGIRCADPVFRAFLIEKHGFSADSEDKAADIVRFFCGVSTRAELGTNHKARVLWHQLDESFLAWKYVDA